MRVSTEQPGDQPDAKACVQDLVDTRVRQGKSVHWRRDPLILERLAAVEKRHVANWTVAAIARELEVSESLVRLDIKRLGEVWLERLGEEVAARRARRLAQLESVIARGLEAAEGADDARGEAAALQVSRQGIMDAAKLEGLVIDKVAPVDSAGNDLLDVDAIRARFAQRLDEQHHARDHAQTPTVPMLPPAEDA
jgi:hypothetical protein